jgi:AcrR family transcriptional regulator
MKTSRTYVQSARAQSADETRLRIVDAFFGLAEVRMFPDISLDDVATAAGVSVQTILRHFGTRAGVIDATTEHALAQVADERATPVGDVDAAVRVIVDHYEQRGRTALLMLAQESRDSQIGKITEQGRRMHREWVEETFSPFATAGHALIDLLVVATDVYTWKLLRLDRGHSRARTEQLIHHMVTTLIAADQKGVEE